MQVKLFMKQLLNSLVIFMISFTMVMFPYPSSISNSNISYAEESGEEPKCLENSGSDDGKGGLYQVGCEFEQVLPDANISDSYQQNFMGYVEQFIGAVFAMIGVSLVARPIPKVMAQCPQHLGAKVTFPIVMAGSLTYLIGEINANIAFKNASKIEVDKTTASYLVKKDEDKDRVDKDTLKINKEANQKQLESYYTLAEVYDKQAKGLNTKVGLVTASQIAFLTAEVFEITDMSNATIAGTGMKKAAIVANETAKKALLGTYTAAASLQPVLVCKAYMVPVHTYITQLEAYDPAKELIAAGKASKRLIRLSGDVGRSFKAFAEFPIPVAFDAPLHLTEIAEDEASAIEDDLRAKTAKTTRAGIFTSLTPAGTVCASECVANPSCAPASASFIAAATAQMTKIEGLRANPILCTGADSMLIPDYDSSTMWAVRYAKPDNFFPDSQVGFNSIIDKIKNNKFDFFFKSLENFYYRIVFDQLERKKYKTPNDKLMAFKEANQRVSKYVNHSKKYLKSKRFLKDLKRFDRGLILEEEDLKSNILAYLKKFKLNIISEAHAEGEFSEILGLGSKVMLLYFLFNKKLKDAAFPKPKTRAITWGIMSAVNAMILAFDMKKLDDAKKRKDIVLHEAQRFAHSHALKTEIPDGLGDELGGDQGNDASGDPFSGGNDGEIACATPNGDTFTPAQCPTKIPEGRFSVPKSRNVTGSVGGTLDLATGLIGGIAREAATGGARSGSKSLAGKLNSLSGQKDKIIALRDKARKKWDKLEKDIISKSKAKNKKGKPFKSKSLAAIHQQMSSQLGGQQAPNDFFANSAEFDKKLEEMKKKDKSAVASIPKFKIPKSETPSFDFDLGDDSNSAESDTVNEGAEGDLADFQVNENDIIDKPEASLFQVISNRYLRSYPVLLEENKKK